MNKYNGTDGTRRAFKLSACIDTLFVAETDVFADRIRMARDAGLDGVEFWEWSQRDISSIERALKDTGLPLTAMVAEPRTTLTDPACHEAFLSGIEKSRDVARRLGVPTLITLAGDTTSAASPAQRQAITECLQRAADVMSGSGVVLALEPLNDRIDHPGYYLISTKEGLDIVDAIARPEIRLLYDMYHSAVMDERIETVLDGRLDRVAHVHLADTQGRGEPGSGALDWQSRLNWLADTGYSGFVGLEYFPKVPSVTSLSAVQNYSAK